MDLLEVLGLSKPVADCALCLELYFDDLQGTGSAESQQLHALKLRCEQLLQPLVARYIWQQEPLRLQSSLQQEPLWVVKAGGSSHGKQKPVQQQPPCLWSILRYEDNVEDEWFVVWLLLLLTQQMPGLTARCWDDDGDFLLIEAAYSLPRWLKPETAKNRVWLRTGQLHIVPPPSQQHPTLPAAPSVSEALSVLRSGAVQTRRKRVEAAVLQRVADYPARGNQQLQKVVAWLPRRLGLVLQEDPQIVSRAVSAFMTRDRKELQAACKLRHFPTADMTTAVVTLNRCMYAQLIQVDFATPNTYPNPPAGDWLGGDTARQHKAVSMGVKLAVGMEIHAARLGIQLPPVSVTATAPAEAVARTQSACAAEQGPAVEASITGSQAFSSLVAQQPQQADRQQPHDAGLSSNPAWHTYRAVLQRSGYFDGELEGSARHRQLLSAAQAAFISSEAYQQSKAAAEAPKQHLLRLLAAASSTGAPADVPTVDCEQQQLSPVAAMLDVSSCGVDTLEDGDQWMQEEAEAMNKRLQQAEDLAAAPHRSTRPCRQPAPGTAAAAADHSDAGMEVDAEQLLSGLKGFMQHAAGPDGAEVPSAAAVTAAGLATRRAEDAADLKDTHADCPVKSTGNSSSSSSSRENVVPTQHALKSSNKGQPSASSSHAAAAAAGELQCDPQALLMELASVLGCAQGADTQSPEDLQSLLQEVRSLQTQLEQLARPSQPQAAASRSRHTTGAQVPQDPGADSDDYGSDGGSSSSSAEGSSFYGSKSESEDERPAVVDDRGRDGVGGFGDAGSALEGVADKMLPVPPPVSSRRTAAQQDAPGGQQQSKTPWGHHDAWEVMTATDSDDDTDGEDALSLGSSEGDGTSSAASDAAGMGLDNQQTAQFFESYSAALEAELAGTAMAQTFERMHVMDDAEDTAAGHLEGGASSSSGSRPTAAPPGAASSAGLSPLDVDFNLIKSLAASYTAQGGLPGPASNLAGLLGLQLPTDVDLQDLPGEEEGSSSKQ